MLQIYRWDCRRKNFENRLTVGEVVGKSLVSCFLPHGVYNSLFHPCGDVFDVISVICSIHYSYIAIAIAILSPYSHTYYYWYSITHSLFHSRLKSFLFCKSSLPQPFLFLLQDSLYGFPRLFTVTSEHIRLFTFFLFLHFFSCRFRAVD